MEDDGTGEEGENARGTRERSPLLILKYFCGTLEEEKVEEEEEEEKGGGKEERKRNGTRDYWKLFIMKRFFFFFYFEQRKGTKKRNISMGRSPRGKKAGVGVMPL